MAATSQSPPDWTSQTEQQVLDHAIALSATQGWTQTMALAAGAAIGLSQGETELLLPHGPADLGALLKSAPGSSRYDVSSPHSVTTG